jgi:transposase
MPRSPNQEPIKHRRSYTDEFKSEAVQMMLDGHSPQSIQERLGLPSTALLFRWRKQQLEKAGPVGDALHARVKELETELRRLQRERDVLPLDLSTHASAFSGSFRSFFARTEHGMRRSVPSC